MGDSTDLNYEEEVHRVLEQARKLQEDAALAIASIASQEEPLRQRAASLDSHIRRLCGSIRSQKFDSKQAEKWEEELSRARGSLIDGDAATYLPSKSPGRLLRMFLGPINVRANRKDVQLKVKEEYNSFRDRTAFLFLVFPLLLLGLGFWVWNGCLPALPVQLYQAWLLFLYTCLALRENILRVNGSDIRPWWIYHHYFAMAMALISLTWEIERGPNCSHKQRGVQLFLGWATMQGFAMLLQNRYQRQRLYTRIALGKARRMDVVWGETAGVNGQLLVLFPILILMQVFEAYVGVLLLKTAAMGVVSEWQVVTCGVLLIVMAIGNFINTMETLVTKSKVKAKMRSSKSKPDLNPEFDGKTL